MVTDFGPGYEGPSRMAQLYGPALVIRNYGLRAARINSIRISRFDGKSSNFLFTAILVENSPVTKLVDSISVNRLNKVIYPYNSENIKSYDNHLSFGHRFGGVCFLDDLKDKNHKLYEYNSLYLIEYDYEDFYTKEKISKNTHIFYAFAEISNEGKLDFRTASVNSEKAIKKYIEATKKH